MTGLRRTPTRMALVRAIANGDVTEYRDGALARTAFNGSRVVPYNRIVALEEAGLIRLAGGRPSWIAGPYRRKPFELTDDGREFLGQETKNG